MLKRTKKVSLLATIFCLIASLLMLVGFQSISAKAEDNVAQTVTVKTFKEVTSADSQSYNGDAHIGDLGAQTYVAFNADVTLPSTTDYKVAFSFLTNGGSVWASGTAVVITEGKIRFSEITRSDWYDSTGAYTNEAITGGATFNIEIGVKAATTYYVKYEGAIIAEWTDGLGAAQGTGICSYSNQAYTLSEPIPDVTVKTFKEVTGADSQNYSGDAYIGDLGAQTYVAFNADVTLPSTTDYKVAFSFLTNGGSVWASGTAVVITEGKIRFSEITRSDWYDSTGAYTNEAITGGATFNIEIGVKAATTYYVKYEGAIIAEWTDGLGAAQGTGICSYSNQAYMLSAHQEATPEVEVKDLADVAGVNEFTLANNQGKLVDLGASTYTAVKFKMTIPNPMSGADSMFITLGSAGGDFGWNGYGGAITVCLYCQGCFVFTEPATHNGLSPNVQAAPADQSIIAPGATLTVEVGTYEAGHYYIKVNDTLWSEISGYNAPAGSYVGFYTPVDSYTFATTKEIPATPEVEVKDFLDVAGVEEVALGIGQGHVVDLGASTYTAIKFKITLPMNSIGPDSLFVAFGSNGEGGQYGYNGAVTLCLYCPECLVFTEGGTHNGLTLGEGEYITSDQSSIAVGGGELIIELGAYESGHYYVKVNDVLWEEVINRPAALGTKVGFYVGNDGYLIQSTAIQPEPEFDEKDVSDLMGEDYKIVNGNVCLGDVGVDEYYNVKMRLTLTENYDVKFFLNSDGETPCNTGAFGGLYSIRLTGGNIMGGFPGGWHFYSEFSTPHAALTVGSVINLEIGMAGYNENGTPVWVVKVNGEIVVMQASAAYGDFMGVTGTKLAVSSATMILVEDSEATCNHAFAWTEPDITGYTEYKCSCGIVIESKYVAVDADFISLVGQNYKVVHSWTLLGNLTKNNYYNLKMRVYIPNQDDYDIYFNLNGDGTTSAGNGVLYGGEASIRICNGQIMFGYPGAWHIPYTNGAPVANDAIVKGAVISLEIAVNGRDENDIPLWIVSINGQQVLSVTDKAYGESFMGAAGTYVSMYSNYKTVITSYDIADEYYEVQYLGLNGALHDYMAINKGEACVTANAAISNNINRFIGWYYNDKLYNVGSTVAIDSNVVFTAYYAQFYMTDGAAVRLISAHPGIRFEANLFADELLTQYITEYGGLISTSDLAKGALLDLDSSFAHKKLVFDLERWVEDDNNVMRFSLIDLLPSNINREFIGRSYITLTYEDGSTATVYTYFDVTEHTRTIYEVSLKALKSDYASTVGDTTYLTNRGMLLDYVNGVIDLQENGEVNTDVQEYIEYTVETNAQSMENIDGVPVINYVTTVSSKRDISNIKSLTFAGKRIRGANYSCVQNGDTYVLTITYKVVIEGEKISVLAYSAPEVGQKSTPTVEDLKTYFDAGYKYLLLELSNNMAYVAFNNGKTSEYISDLEYMMNLALQYESIYGAGTCPVLIWDANVWAAQNCADTSTFDSYKDNITEVYYLLRDKYYSVFKGYSFSDEPCRYMASAFANVYSYIYNDLGGKDLKYFFSMLPSDGADLSSEYLNNAVRLTSTTPFWADSTGYANVTTTEYTSWLANNTYGVSSASYYSEYLYYLDSFAKEFDQYGIKDVMFGCDIYPFRSDDVFEPYYLSVLECTARVCQKYGFESSLTVQTMSDGTTASSDNTFTYFNKQSYISQQIYAALAYGAKEYATFTYMPHHYATSSQSAIMGWTEENGEWVRTKTAYYDWVKSTNNAVNSFDNVLSAYEWKGTVVKKGTFSSVIRYQKSYSSYTDSRLTVTQAYYDLIVGCFDCTLSSGNDAYMFVNMEYASNTTARTYKFKLADCTQVIAYQNGNVTTLTADSNGVFTLNLAAGNACFVVAI